MERFKVLTFQGIKDPLNLIRGLNDTAVFIIDFDTKRGYSQPLEFLKKMRVEWKEPYCLSPSIITSFAPNEYLLKNPFLRLEWANSWKDRYIQKPFYLSELAEKINNVEPLDRGEWEWMKRNYVCELVEDLIHHKIRPALRDEAPNLMDYFGDLERILHVYYPGSFTENFREIEGYVRKILQVHRNDVRCEECRYYINMRCELKEEIKEKLSDIVDSLRRKCEIQRTDC